MYCSSLILSVVVENTAAYPIASNQPVIPARLGVVRG